MKYIKAIFENEDVKSLAVANEALVQLATESLLAHNIAIQSHIYENLDLYLVEGDLAATYENIRNEVLNENVTFINESAAILGSDLSEEEKVSIFEAKGKPKASRYKARRSRLAKKNRNQSMRQQVATPVPNTNQTTNTKPTLSRGAKAAIGAAALLGGGAGGATLYNAYKDK